MGKVVFTWVFTIVFLSTALAQEKPNVPVNESTGMVEYVEVVTVNGASPETLYQRLEHWFNTYYTNPTKIIKSKEENQSIKGQHSLNIDNAIKGTIVRVGIVKYQIEIGVKDGKYRYKIHDIFMINSPKTYVHQWLDENDKLKEHNFNYLDQVHQFMTAITSNLKGTMAKPIPSEGSDDW